MAIPLDGCKYLWTVGTWSLRTSLAALSRRSSRCCTLRWRRSPPACSPHPRGPLRKNHNAIARTAGVERSAATSSTQPVYIQMRWNSHAIHHDGFVVSGNRFLKAGGVETICVAVTIVMLESKLPLNVVIQWCELLHFDCPYFRFIDCPPSYSYWYWLKFN